VLLSLSALLHPPAPFLLFFYRSPDHRDLHSFPTRRSSDLALLHGLRQARATPPRRSPRTRPGPLPSVVVRVVVTASSFRRRVTVRPPSRRPGVCARA